ncbi:ATP-binding protein [Algoriphagus lutimaris]|uniref:ATP-binding protein n=1 Tax=Algoriphagus lutimaris TaxID=613197 RepID=UPI001FB04893|nr:ATP-binding protein [Algoriphagus lutimaris]
MRLLLIISFFVGLVNSSQSQGFTEEYRNFGIYNELRAATEDTTKVNVYIQLSNFHKFSRPDSGIFYASKALVLSRSINFVLGEVKALHQLSLSYQTLGDFTKALRICSEGLRIGEDLNENTMKAKFIMNQGNNSTMLGNFEEAIRLLHTANDLFQEANDQNFISINHSLLARAFLGNQKIDSAFHYGYKSKVLAEELQVSWVLVQPYNELGKAHSQIGNFDSAIYYLKKSFSQFHSESQSGEARILLDIAKVFKVKNELDSSLYYAIESLTKATENMLFVGMKDGSKFLVEFYQDSDPKKALVYSKQALSASDSLAKMLNMSAFSDFNDYDEQQRKYELEVAKKEYQSKLNRNIFLGSTFTFLIIGFFLIRNNRQKQKAKVQIEGAYNQLKSTQAQLIQSEKMASLGELTAGIAHEIQNPLNFVNNFSEVSTELVDEMKEELAAGSVQFAVEIADDLKQNLEKITLHGKRADAIVKGMLEHSKRGSGQKQPTYLNVLADEFLRLSYQSFLAKEPDFKCELKTDLAPDLPQVSVIPQDIGKVLLNLMNNAFYAINEKTKLGKTDSDYKPIVTVSSTYSPLAGGQGGFVELSVQDNGSGIPDSIKEKIFQPFFTSKPTGSGTGLGLSLSYDIVKAHGGEIRVESEEGEGTTFIISLPFKINQ